MTAFRLINFRGLSPQRKAPFTTGRQTRESAWSNIQKPHTAPNAAFRKISVPPTRPSRLRTNKKTPDNAQAHSVPAMPPSGAPLPLQAVIEKPCLFPLSRALFHRTQKAPNRAQTHSVPRHEPPIRRASQKSRAVRRPQNRPSAHRRASANPAGICRAHSHFNPHPANRPHALLPIIPRKTRAEQGASPQRPRHEPPRPGRSFSYCAIIALPCGAFRASSAARR